MFNNHDISKLTAPKYRPLVRDYTCFLQTGLGHFGNKNLPADIRLQKLTLLEKALRRQTPFTDSLIYKLQKAFVAENLSVSLLLEPLTAWRYPAAGKYPTSGAQVSELLNRMLSPAARLILALDNENPATYLPLTTLFVLLCLQEMIQTDDIFLKKARISKKQLISRLNGLYKSACVLLSLVKNKRLKFQLALLLNTARLHTLKLKNNLHDRPAFLDYVLIFAYSVFQFLFIKRKSVNFKGI